MGGGFRMKVTGGPTFDFLYALTQFTNCDEFQLKVGDLIKIFGDVKVELQLSSLDSSTYITLDVDQLKRLIRAFNDKRMDDEIQAANKEDKENKENEEQNNEVDEKFDKPDESDNSLARELYNTMLLVNALENAVCDNVDKAVEELIRRSPDRRLHGSLFSDVCNKYGIDSKMIPEMCTRLQVLGFRSLNGKDIYPALLRGYLRYKVNDRQKSGNMNNGYILVTDKRIK